MKKTLTLLAAISLVSLSNTAFSADFITNGAGEAIEIDTGNTDATANITFQPSTRVIMDGASDNTAFAAGAYHEAVLNKNSGKQFAMASDASVVFFLDISEEGTGAAEDLSGITNRAELIGTNANWHTM